LPLGTTPHGFVRVAAEAFSWREQGFYLQEREVTCAEYAAFLATCATPEFRPAGPAWTWRDGAGAFVGSDEQRAEPVVGVSWAAATAFCRWVDAHWPKPPGHRCALPSTLQWTRAAKGGDGRTFVFGNELRMEWVRRAAAPDDRPSPVLSHPHDESPWGAFDLAGSVAEWCDDGADTETAPVCGGSWRDRHAAAFRSLPRQVPKVTCSDSIGFRVVWRRSEDLR
jgi:formylglycine-generating enzyme required for sulfatase activity